MRRLLWSSLLGIAAFCNGNTCRADGWLSALKNMKSDRYLYENVVVPFRNSEVNRYLYENVTKDLQVEVTLGEAAIGPRSIGVALVRVRIGSKKE